jgi:hypothetical protein
MATIDKLVHLESSIYDLMQKLEQLQDDLPLIRKWIVEEKDNTDTDFNEMELVVACQTFVFECVKYAKRHDVHGVLGDLELYCEAGVGDVLKPKQTAA